MSKVTLIATATMGVEALVAKEVRALGYEDANVENGKVTFTGDESAICRSNLWLRTADRVEVLDGDFGPLTEGEVAKGVGEGIRLSCQVHVQEDATVSPAMTVKESNLDAGPRPE